MKTTQLKLSRNNVLRLVKAASAIKDRNKRFRALVKLANITGQMEKRADFGLTAGILSLIAGLASAGYMGYEGYTGRKAVEEGERQRAAEWAQLMQRVRQQQGLDAPQAGDPYDFLNIPGAKAAPAAKTKSTRLRGYKPDTRLQAGAEPETTKPKPMGRGTYTPYTRAEAIRNYAAQHLGQTNGPVQTSMFRPSSSSSSTESRLPSIMPTRVPQDHRVADMDKTEVARAKEGSSRRPMEKKAYGGAIAKAMGALGLKKAVPWLIGKASPNAAKWIASKGFGPGAARLLGNVAGMVPELYAYGQIGEAFDQWSNPEGYQEQPEGYGPEGYGPQGMGDFTPEEFQYALSTMPPEVQAYYNQMGMGPGLSDYTPEYSQPLPVEDLTEVDSKPEPQQPQKAVADFKPKLELPGTSTGKTQGNSFSEFMPTPNSVGF